MSEREHVHEHSHGHPHVHGHVHDPEQTKKISNRLARAIGHLESIKKMVEDDRDCSEVLIQLAAVESAIRSTSRQILRNHMDTCVTAAIQQNDEETLSELYRAIDELLKNARLNISRTFFIGMFFLLHSGQKCAQTKRGKRQNNFFRRTNP